VSILDKGNPPRSLLPTFNASEAVITPDAHVVYLGADRCEEDDCS
jgi:hypothetical protein